MKKLSCLLLALAMLLALSACGGKQPEEIREWTRQGFFQNENGDVLSVTYMDDITDPGWYVGVMLGDVMTGWTVPQEGNSLHGDLNAWDESAEPFIVTVSEEGEDGLLLVVEGGESYHFVPMEMPEATIFVTINVDGLGAIEYAEGEEPPEIDPEYPFQSAQIPLAEPTVYTIVAWSKEGSAFVKWTKDGEDYSTEPQITVLLDESADYVAVFEDGLSDGQNPVMNFIGRYVYDRAVATVEALGDEDALITIEWGGSAWELARWVMSGRFDEDTLTVAYDNCVLSSVTFAEDGSESAVVEYENGTGRIVFSEDLSFVWQDDHAEEEPVFVWSWEPDLGDLSWYEMVTAMDKAEVEALCVTVLDAYLSGDWDVIAPLIRYPITINGTELKDAEAFLAYMADKTVHESDRAVMLEESCHDMFVNGQGICMGSGQIWLNDMNYMTDEAPKLEIVALSGIVDK